MKKSRLIEVLKNRSMPLSFLTVLPMLVVILGLTACFKHPVGDPEKSKVDPKFAGAWCGEDPSSYLILRPYDSRTYIIHHFEFEENKGKIQPHSREDFKGWLTVIGGETFLTMEPLSFEEFLGDDEAATYWVAKFTLVDNSIHMLLLDDQNKLLKESENQREFEAAIEKQLKSKSLYADSPMVFTKNQDQILLRSVIDAFHNWDSDES